MGRQANYNHREGFVSMIAKVFFLIFLVLFMSSGARTGAARVVDLIHITNRKEAGTGSDPKHDHSLVRINREVLGEPNPINDELPGGHGGPYPKHDHPLVRKNQP